jgi:hypothetical protein
MLVEDPGLAQLKGEHDFSGVMKHRSDLDELCVQPDTKRAELWYQLVGCLSDQLGVPKKTFGSPELLQHLKRFGLIFQGYALLIAFSVFR